MNKILIAEDEAPIADLIRTVLTDAGYRCVWVSDGAQAADLLEKEPFDLALLDIMLPGVNGYELLEYCRELEVPAIFLTAKAEVEDRVKGLRLGAEDYLPKPFALPELLARVETVLRRCGKTERVLRLPPDIEIDTASRLVREGAAYIYQEGRRLESLSRKLMDMVVLDREGIALRAVEMPAFLERMAGTLRPALEQRGIRLEFAAEPGTVNMDPDLMESVCLNLLDNARKAVTEQGVIQLNGITEGPGYCIQVTDNGRGIPAEDLGRLTEAFYMVDKSRSRSEGGAGLGLSVCQRIVALHGGTMEFESTPGQGTSVRVHLKGGVQS